MLYSQMFAHQNCLLENTMLGFVKALPLILALAILGLFTASCNSSNNAHVRFVNAIADTEDYGNTGLDIDFNGTKEFTDVAFSGIQPTSGYTPVPSGSVTVNGLETGGTNVIFSLPGVDLSSGTDYTLVSTGNVLETNVKIISPADNNTAPANGSVNFRVINASPSGPGGGGAAADVYVLQIPNDGIVGETPQISGLAYDTTSSYVTVPFNSGGEGWSLIVTVHGGTTPFMNTTINNFGSATTGAICTLVLTDQQEGNQMNSSPIYLNDLNGCTGP